MKPTQIEQTGKKYKGALALGVLAIIAGIMMMIAGWAADTPGHGGTVMGFGIAMYFVARVGAWWDHG